MKQTEIGMIPDDWEVNLIGNVSEIFGRIGFRGYTVEDLVDEGFGAITLSPSNIQNGKMDFSNCSYISWKKYDESPEIKIANGDILLVKTGSTYGKSAIVKNLAKKATINPQFVVIKKTKCNNELLGYLIQTPIVQEQIEASIVGGAIPTLSQKQIASFKIPLSKSIKEQQRIAKALSDVDALISTTEKLLQKKRNIKQGTMQELLTGKKRLSDFTKSTEYKQTELGLIPEDWEVKKIKDFAKVYDGTHQTPHYIEVGIPFYSVENVTANDFYHTKFISEEEHKLLTSKVRIEKGDILMTRIGSIGDCKYVDWEPNASFYVSLALIKCDMSVDARFISYYSHSLQFKEELERRSLVTAIPQKINLGPISEIILLLPSKEEQTAIANVLSSMDKEIETLNTKLEKYRNLKTAMMQQLLTGKIRLVK